MKRLLFLLLILFICPKSFSFTPHEDMVEIDSLRVVVLEYLGELSSYQSSTKYYQTVMTGIMDGTILMAVTSIYHYEIYYSVYSKSDSKCQTKMHLEFMEGKIYTQSQVIGAVGIIKDGMPEIQDAGLVMVLRDIMKALRRVDKLMTKHSF